MSVSNTTLASVSNQTHESWADLRDSLDALKSNYLADSQWSWLDGCRLAASITESQLSALKGISECEEVTLEMFRDNHALGRYQYNRHATPAFSVTSEEIVVSWCTSQYVEDVFENIINNWWSKEQRVFFAAVPDRSQPEIDVKWEGYYGIKEGTVMAYKFYKFVFPESLPYDQRHPTVYEPLDRALDVIEGVYGFPTWLERRNAPYLKARVAKLREKNVPLRPLRSRPSQTLDRYERLALLAKSLVA